MHYVANRLIVALLFSFSMALNGNPVDLEGMVPRNPKPPPSHIIEATFQNERWIVGADNGILSHSEDGINWSTLTVPYAKGVEAVIHWNGWYYAAGVDSRTLMRSIDLVNWVEENPSGYPFNPKQFLVHDDKLFVVGWSPGLAYSEDGINWTEIPVEGGERLDGIATNGNRLVLVGTNGLIYTSENGMEWTLLKEGIEGLEGLDDDFMFVNWLGGQFIAGGKQGLVMTSPDGLTWDLVQSDTTDWFFNVIQFEGAYYFTGRSGNLHRSIDLVTFDTVPTGLTSTINDVFYNGSAILVAGRDGNAAVSEDGENWDQSGQGTREYMFEIEHGAGAFVAADANGGIWKSNDTEGWILVHTVSDQRSARGLVFVDSQFVAVSSNGFLITSPDGETWTESEGFEGSPNRMRYLNSQYIVVGESGLVAMSGNLSNWTISTVGSESIADIAFGNGVYVVAGRSGSLHYSANGIDWTEVDTGTDEHLKAVAFTNGTFAVLGRSSQLFNSTDGMNWTNNGVPGQTPFDSQRIEVIDGLFVTVGYLGNCGTSEDGISWDLKHARISQSLFDVLCVDNRTVAVGTFGTIMSTPFVLTGGYEEWRQLRFNQAERADPAISGPDADPDLDRRTNAFEFFSNTAPLVYDEGPPYTTYYAEEGGNWYQYIEVVRRITIAGTELSFWRTSNLRSWESVVEDLEFESSDPLDAETELLRYRVGSQLDQRRTDLISVGVQIQE